MTEVARKVCTTDAANSCTTTVLSGDGTAEVALQNISGLYLEMGVSASNPISLAYLWPSLPRIIRTSDPLLSYRLFAGGVQIKPGQTVDIATIVPCGVWSNQDWEDGGNGSPDNILEHAKTDVHYDVQGICTSQTSGNGATLTE